MNIFGVGASEALLVLVLALIVVGPQRFPEIARQSGRWFKLARGYTDEVMKDVRSAVDEIEQEINVEASDLRSLGDVSGIGSELRSIREDVESVTKEAATEAETAVSSAEQSANETRATTTIESTDASESSLRPSKCSQDS
jgi:sec-independent protein translocase protein TatB